MLKLFEMLMGGFQSPCHYLVLSTVLTDIAIEKLQEKISCISASCTK